MHQDDDRLVNRSGSAVVHAAPESNELALRGLAGMIVRTVRATDEAALSALFDRLSPDLATTAFSGPRGRSPHAN